MDKWEKYGNAIILALLLFSDQVLGEHVAVVHPYMWAILCFSTVHVIYKTIKNIDGTKMAAFNLSTLWIGIFAVIVFVYGFWSTTNPGFYSREYHLLCLIHIALIMIVIYQSKDDLADTLGIAAVICLMGLTILILLYDKEGLASLVYNGYTNGRLGVTFKGGVIESSMTMIFCSMPIMYQIMAKKKMWYIPFAVVGLVMLALNGSRTGFLAIALAALLILLSCAKDRKTQRNLFMAFVAVVAVMLLISYVVPYLRLQVWGRITDLFTVMLSQDIENENSATSIRIKYFLAVVQNYGDKPMFGHGLYAFKSQFCASKGWYQDHSHTNYTEILYSFGYFGLIMYYWFPIYTIILAIKEKNHQLKYICFAFIASLIIIDFGNTTFYMNIVGYIGFAITYMMLKTQGSQIEEKKSGKKQFNK